MKIIRKTPSAMPDATDVLTTFRRRWYCTPPPSRLGIRWRATDYAWSDDGTVQDIYAWERIPDPEPGLTP